MKHLLFYTLFLMGSSSFAQTEQENIKTTINQLFEGMKTGDSSLVAAVFHPEVTLQTVTINKQGETTLHKEQLASFLNAVGSPHEGVWNEKITFTRIQIDDQMAHVWTDYQFYLDETFIHCGVNSFQLVKLNKQWQIVHLMDTRRKKECNEKAFNR